MNTYGRLFGAERRVRPGTGRRLPAVRLAIAVNSNLARSSMRTRKRLNGIVCRLRRFRPIDRRPNVPDMPKQSTNPILTVVRSVWVGLS